ncbi:hypothetical protein TCAL_02058 [Tigriopus californicus]|uniref:RING-type E3 ubiquitin transferase n=1 Tax=Tigriopus californicus TaxID=6832 RepID=A0A553NB83_TIGCA|nr:E3 ubiquitin-protein ligase UHRF1-like [Tigriopus californicus]TRY62677.1 hypothetical protein TCAL_02058 [Tigriopus californicus]|eukprot:TCALIF_02058-PA protein Name:"Similar to uhrf1 E3 ubiquitin-protein ligase UHRF1 (Xenopus laevis)" AED:0.01 eAED:0.01 QI:297/1/1/1/1/1/3/116/612
MHIKIRHGGQIYLLPDISKMSTIRSLRKKIQDKTGVEPKRQRLIAKGKQLDDDYTLIDYGVDVNCLVDVLERLELPRNEKEIFRLGINEDVKENAPQNGQFDSPEPEEKAIDIQDIYHGDPKDLVVECKQCNDNPKKKCGECGCKICRGKERPELNLMCDECEYCYHIFCLDPPLETIPDGDWYCPECKNDESEIVAPGAKLKASLKKSRMPSYQNKSNRDWGKGMATAGRTKSCTKVPSNHFGPIPGVEVGMCWKYRLQMSEQGVHRPPVAGIAGRPTEGAFSIVLAGGYEDDVDNGDEFYYTGAGGRDLSGNKRTAEQSFDQVLDKTNLAIAVSCDCKVDKEKGGEAKNWRKGKPIRVVRSEKLKKHSAYAPQEGCRYDGIYKVVKYWPEKGRSGYIVWRYLFRRDDNTPAPWTKEGRALIERNGFTCIYPEGHLEAMAEKAKSKDLKANPNIRQGTKRTRGNSSDGLDEDDFADMTKAKPTLITPAIKRFKKTTKYNIDADILSLMALDKRNSKLWDDVKQTELRTKFDFTNKVEENFQCLCCQDVIFKPITTSCGHNICHSCLKRAFKSEWTQCPSCRNDLKDEEIRVNHELESVLLKIFPGYDNGRS